jgi:hypothetical protein
MTIHQNIVYEAVPESGRETTLPRLVDGVRFE